MQSVERVILNERHKIKFPLFINKKSLFSFFFFVFAFVCSFPSHRFRHCLVGKLVVEDGKRECNKASRLFSSMLFPRSLSPLFPLLLLFFSFFFFPNAFLSSSSLAGLLLLIGSRSTRRRTNLKHRAMYIYGSLPSTMIAQISILTLYSVDSLYQANVSQ